MTFTSISPRWWIARQLEMVFVFGPILAALAIAASLRPVWWYGFGGAALLAASGWLVERGRYRRWGYTERGEDLVVKRGFLFQRMSIVPYGRMQFIDVEIGPIERAFGLATVQLHTAAAASDARIPGLPRAEAERLRDRLTVAGEAHSTGL